MGIANDLEKTSGLVRELLRDYPELRDCNTKLTLAVLNKKGLRCILGSYAYGLLKEFLLDKDTPDLESIRRNRAKIQNTEGLYKSQKQIQKAREKEEKLVRCNLDYNY